jgi:hypothetical protein
VILLIVETECDKEVWVAVKPKAFGLWGGESKRFSQTKYGGFAIFSAFTSGRTASRLARFIGFPCSFYLWCAAANLAFVSSVGGFFSCSFPARYKSKYIKPNTIKKIIKAPMPLPCN